MTLHKLATTLQLAGALFTLPAGMVGLYTAYQSQFSTEVTCRNLRVSILSTLDKPVDAQAKRVLVHGDLAAFERTCALTDPDAKAVFAAIDRSILFAVNPDAHGSRPVRFSPPPYSGGPPRLEHLFERMRQRPFGT